MASINVMFNKDQGDVTVGFFSGPMVSHWMARLTTTKIQKHDYEGTNDDNIPDQVVLSPTVLLDSAILSWWVVVFAPGGPAMDYTVTVVVSQAGKALCPPIAVRDNVDGSAAESVSGVVSFSVAP